MSFENVLTIAKSRFRLSKNMYYAYQRIFPNGIEVVRHLKEFGPSFIFFDVENFFSYRGFGNYQTLALDKVTYSNQHNSGIGGLSDGFYLAGLVGFILACLFFTIVFSFSDILLSDLVLRVMLQIFFIDLLFSGMGSVSYLFYSALPLRISFPVLLLGHFGIGYWSAKAFQDTSLEKGQ
ncbi:MAG: hypothetical protein OHK0038_28530 [Flammeovirgaceae bacterium]